jgi:hypothetical protein
MARSNKILAKISKIKNLPPDKWLEAFNAGEWLGKVKSTLNSILLLVRRNTK